MADEGQGIGIYVATSPRFVAACKTVSAVAASAVLMGGLVLIGWWLGIEFKSFAFGRGPTNMSSVWNHSYRPFWQSNILNRCPRTT